MITINRHAGQRFDGEAPHPGGGDRVVDVAGYIPKHVQMQMLLDSGKALDDYRRRLFPDFSETGEEMPEDPTAEIGYDIFDALDDRRRSVESYNFKLEQAKLVEAERLRREKYFSEKKEPPVENPAGAGPVA